MTDIPPRWYCVNGKGEATKCADEKSAVSLAGQRNEFAPAGVRWAAVQLAPVPQTVKAGGFKMGDRIEYVNYSGVAFPGTVTGFSISLDDGDSLDCVCAADLLHVGKDENE